MKLKLFGCSALRHELYLFAALSPHEIDIELLPTMAKTALLQSRIDASHGYDYILPCVGECLSVGLLAGETPLVIPRAHNCAHLLLGSVERYHRAFSENDDAPRWMLGGDCDLLSPPHGTTCTVRDSLLTYPGVTAEREYAADLSLLRDYLFCCWDERFLTVSSERVVSDPVEIIACEP